MPKTTVAGGISYEPGHEPGAGEGHVRDIAPASPAPDVAAELEEVRGELAHLEAEVGPEPEQAAAEPEPEPAAPAVPPRVPPRRVPPKPPGND